MAELFTNNAATTVNAGLNNSTNPVTFTVASAAAFPATGNFRILVGNELLLVTARAGASFTCTRGIEGTGIAPHAAGVAVTHVLTAAGLPQLIREQIREETAPLTLPAPPVTGVNYFMTGLDFLTTTYLSRYHLSGVRATVQSQLAAMAAAGTTVLRTPMWFSNITPVSPPEWFIGLPPSAQEQTNIINLGLDVLATGMRWEVGFGWMGCADLEIMPVPCGLTEEQQYVKIEDTLDVVFGLFTPQFRPERIQLYMEVSLVPTRMPTFLTRMWPQFRTLCAAVNTIPSLYGHSAAPMVDVLAFMTTNGLVLPDRAEMSLYLAPLVGGNYASMVTFAEVTAEINLLRTAGLPRIAIAETFYPIDPVERSAWGAKFAQAPALEQLLIWPSTEDPDYEAMPPYDLAAYGRPAGTVTFTGAPVVNQVALFSGDVAITGAPALTYTPATGVLTAGGGTVQPRQDTDLVYGATISAPNVALADWFVINISNTSPHTLPAPINGYVGAEICLTFLTVTGGTLATCVFNAVWKQTGYTPPASGFLKSAFFRFNGTNWYQVTAWAACAL